MDDLLSAALSEAGIDESCLSSPVGEYSQDVPYTSSYDVDLNQQQNEHDEQQQQQSLTSFQYMSPTPDILQQAAAAFVDDAHFVPSEQPAIILVPSTRKRRANFEGDQQQSTSSVLSEQTSPTDNNFSYSYEIGQQASTSAFYEQEQQQQQKIYSDEPVMSPVMPAEEPEEFSDLHEALDTPAAPPPQRVSTVYTGHDGIVRAAPHPHFIRTTSDRGLITQSPPNLINQPRRMGGGGIGVTPMQNRLVLRPSPPGTARVTEEAAFDKIATSTSRPSTRIARGGGPTRGALLQNQRPVFLKRADGTIRPLSPAESAQFRTVRMSDGSVVTQIFKRDGAGASTTSATSSTPRGGANVRVVSARGRSQIIRVATPTGYRTTPGSTPSRGSPVDTVMLRPTSASPELGARVNHGDVEIIRYQRLLPSGVGTTLTMAVPHEQLYKETGHDYGFKVTASTHRRMDLGTPEAPTVRTVLPRIQGSSTPQLQPIQGQLARVPPRVPGAGPIRKIANGSPVIQGGVMLQQQQVKPVPQLGQRPNPVNQPVMRRVVRTDSGREVLGGVLRMEDLDQRIPVGQALKQMRVLPQGVKTQGQQPQVQPLGTYKKPSQLANWAQSLESPIAQTPQKQETASAKDQMRAAMAAGASHPRDADEDEYGYAETYAEYRPSKLRAGLAHPDSVVETSSLSSVDPPEVRYICHIPEYLVDTGVISALQYEAVVYACQMHERRLPSGDRAGYLIGDGAGVGKGRTLATIILENYVLERKRSIWLSVSSDLKYDAERDFRDIGAGNIQVYALNKFKYAKISGKENGNVKKGCVFATYSSLIGECRSAKNKYRSRLKQLIQWFGLDYDGVIIFDECHRAKNLVPTTGAKPTKTGRMVLELQKALPNARIVYASATGATEPRNMAYMTRLGLWGEGQPFPDFGDFISAVERRGVGAMEIVAMDMKQRGLYLARQLSFRGVSFRVEEVPLSKDFIEVYDESVKLWMECRRQFQIALEVLGEEEKASGRSKQIWGQFWACHQRFFKYLCIGAKVEACVQIAREAIAQGKCVVIGLQSTGEARTLDALEEMGGELNEFVSTAKAVLSGLIEKYYPMDADGGVDIFRDFDRMFDDFEGGRKRRRPRPGMDILEELGLGPSSSTFSYATSGVVGGGATKRAKLEGGSGNASEDDNSTTSSSGEDDENTKEDSDAEDEEGSDEENPIGDDDEFLKTLLAEAASSSDDEEDDKKEENETVGEEDELLQRPPHDDSATAEEEFNPFTFDFSSNFDPWASKQRVVDDSPKKPTREELEEKKRQEELKKAEKKERKKEKRRKREKALELLRQKRKKTMEGVVQTATAKEFISSSRLIEDGLDTLNPQMVKAELLTAVERLGPRLPPNTLDQLIDELGGPEFVAEMTGRKGRVVTKETGDVVYELRHATADVPLELMNMDEKDKFMKGEKNIAVISEAASSGISLQSDRRAPNTKRRVHITLELPWSADKAIQQFGRTHRSNQVSAPEYIFLISELAGEQRFASTVAKRLESLGALTHGDRRATESRDLSQFNLDNKYGRAALDVLMRSVLGALDPPLIPAPASYKPGDFFTDMRHYMEGVGLVSRMRSKKTDDKPKKEEKEESSDMWFIEKEASNISKFLNRILGLPVHAQNALFGYFSDILSELIAQAKHDGTYDMGIMDLGTGGDQVNKLETRIFTGPAEKGGFRVEVHKLGVERGVRWEDAYAIWKEHNTDEDGFYVAQYPHSNRKVAALVYGIGKKRLETGARLYAVTRPSTGRSPKLESLEDLRKKFTKVTPEEARIIWVEQYDCSARMCQHKYIYSKCRNELSGVYCEIGRRSRTYFVLSGAVLSVWPHVEDLLATTVRHSVTGKTKSGRMQVIRVRTDEDLKIVGLLVMPQYVRSLIGMLEELCGRARVDVPKQHQQLASKMIEEKLD